MAGYIRLHRQIIHWEWYTDINTKTLFLHCLLMANHKDNCWRGVNIKQGSFVSSLRKLALETGLTVSQTRTSINKLILTQEIAQEPHTSMTIIKVLNYAVYQGKVDDEIDDDSTQTAQEITDKSQTNRTQVSKQIATNKNEKKLKNEKNDKNKDLKSVRFTPPTLEEVTNYCNERKNKIDSEHFIAHYTSNGWKQSNGNLIKDWKSAIITWEKRDKKNNEVKEEKKEYLGTVY